MIRKLLHTFALAAALCLGACGESEAERLGLADSQPSPLFYEIRGAEGEVEGWLFGTIHALPDGVEWRTPNMDEVIAEADLLLVEVAELEDRSATSAIFSNLATTPGSGPLPPRVDPELRGILEEMLALSDFEEDHFDAVEDWAAAIMISRISAVGDPRSSVDRALVRAFGTREVRGFETIEGQLGVFDGLAPEDQRALLEGTILEWHHARADRGQLMRSWFYGHPAALERSARTGILADPELREALLVGRNRDWMPLLLETLEGPDEPLVAVGTAHLVGPDGLVAMLEERGYTLVRLPPDDERPFGLVF